MKSEAWRLIAAFLAGCLCVSFLFFWLLQSTKHPVEVEHVTEESKFVDVDTKDLSGPHRPAQDPAFKLKLDPNKKLIILLAAFRSGSTFLGNLFDSNPRMQYMLEVLYSERDLITRRVT